MFEVNEDSLAVIDIVGYCGCEGGIVQCMWWDWDVLEVFIMLRVHQ